MTNEDRWRIRQEKAAPILSALHTWMLAPRDLVPEGSAIAKSLDYSLKRWAALTRYAEDGAVPIDNNAVENQIRPWATFELVVRWLVTQRQTCGSEHEFDPDGAHEWP